MKGFFYRASYLFILLCYVPAVRAQVLQVTLQEVLTIGDDEEAAKEYLFAGPSHIQVDGQGHIYVADMHQASIRVFNAKGVFITRIGSRGQGPGEFSNISAMTIDHNGDLMVLDHLNARITRYSQMGEQFATYPIPGESMVIASQMWPLADDGFAIAFMEQDNRIDFVHIYDTDFTSRQGSLIPRSYIWDLSKPYEKAISGIVRNTSFAYDGERYFAVPRIYQGELYVYTRTTTSGTPQVWHGHALDGPSYTLLDFDEAFKDGKIMYPTAHYVSTRDGQYAALAHSKSRGLHVLSDGKLVHFFSRERGNNHRLYVELFHRDGTYIGYGEMTDIDLPPKDEPFFSQYTM